ncbi:uncharacterized protein EV420DRAFT_1566356 [Desarmillaria tabescens]|uniref:Actin-like ATPase domain-containing protein n=1 Tax=Armillaria tabescens TaxID=1929756 RepID=A0AA39MWU3_ARMTA|nr:uncharacterized protein EV420DRAFT_1566356 [Desarmillaria tabescens]KAK0448954.1 hypothetical protein EV420DRAFT_1566356 [Desarmillaria tabescens]
MNTIVRKPYSGSRRKLVLAFDLGTTFSGISYTVLDPGTIPEIKGVTRFPSQEHVGSDAKIPTVMYYDCEGTVKAIGAEALKENIIEAAEDEGWTKYSEFKLHLRPVIKTEGGIKSEFDVEMHNNIAPFPLGKDLIAVFADFFKYLFQCAKTFIMESHQSAETFWNSVEGHIEFILTHPNGWEGEQQSRMRRAAVQAGLVADDDTGHARVHFVTEGEASLHFCIHHGLSSHIKNDEGVVIVDAGGGTVDISTYSSVQSVGRGTQRLFEEITTPQCHFTGSVFVTKNARKHLEEKLRGSRFEPEVDLIAECFDKATKLRFRNAEEPAYIKFGTMRDREPAFDIRSGQLKLAGSVVSDFFQPSINSIINTIDEQRLKSRKPITSIFLVGGFAASDWLFVRLQEYLTPLKVSFSRPDSHVNKAVADGAVSFYLDRFVSTRVARFHYGVKVHTEYDPANVEHQRRRNKTYPGISGELKLDDQYDTILAKDVQVSEDKEFRRSYYRDSKLLSDLETAKADILCYNGSKSDPRWMDTEPDVYPALCYVTADTREAAKALALRRREDGKSYYRLTYDVIILFGRTEMKAQICWMENGIEKRGPARIVYDRDI